MGMEIGSKYQRETAYKNLDVLATQSDNNVKEAINKLLSVKDSYTSKAATEELVALLKTLPLTKTIQNVLDTSHHLPKKST